MDLIVQLVNPVAAIAGLMTAMVKAMSTAQGKRPERHEDRR